MVYFRFSVWTNFEHFKLPLLATRWAATNDRAPLLELCWYIWLYILCDKNIRDKVDLHLKGFDLIFEFAEHLLKKKEKKKDSDSSSSLHVHPAIFCIN